jgi:hypothetical protein
MDTRVHTITFCITLANTTVEQHWTQIERKYKVFVQISILCMKTREMSRCLYYRDVYCEKSLFQTIISLHDRESNEAINRTHNTNKIKILTGVHTFKQLQNMEKPSIYYKYLTQYHDTN